VCVSVCPRSSHYNVYDFVMGRVMDDDDAVPVPVSTLWVWVRGKAWVRWCRTPWDVPSPGGASNGHADPFTSRVARTVPN